MLRMDTADPGGDDFCWDLAGRATIRTWWALADGFTVRRWRFHRCRCLAPMPLTCDGNPVAWQRISAARWRLGHPDRPIHELLGFAAGDVESGQTADVAIACTLRPV